MMNTPRKELEKLEKELKEDTPEPLLSMLAEKQDNVEAINVYKSRKRKIMTDCPPTCSGKNSCFLHYFSK